MIGELNVYGFYIPWGIVMFFASLAVSRLISRGLARFGFYRYVWHPALFDLLLVIIVMGVFFLIFSARGF